MSSTAKSLCPAAIRPPQLSPAFLHSDRKDAGQLREAALVHRHLRLEPRWDGSGARIYTEGSAVQML